MILMALFFFRRLCIALFCVQLRELPQQNKPARGGGDGGCTDIAGDDDGNHMCLWCGVLSPVRRCGLLEDKWVLIKQIPPMTPQGPAQQSCSLDWAACGVDWLPAESRYHQHVCGARALIGLPHHRSLYTALHFNPFISHSLAAGGGSGWQ